MNMKKSIALVGIQSLFKTLLYMVIGSFIELDVKKAYDTTADAIGLLSYPADIVLIDIGHDENDHSGFELIRKLHAFTHVQCIVCTMKTNDQVIRTVFEAGASGFINLDAPYDEIMQLFGVIVKGGVPVSDFVMKRLISFMVDHDIQSVPSLLPQKNSNEIISRACILIDAYQSQSLPAPQQKMSEFLISSLHLSYGYLCALFLEEKGISLRDYVIKRKIERVKSMMRIESMTLTQIANKLDYSSVAHLSSQFLKVVGINASTYRSRMTAVKDVRTSSLCTDS